MAVLLNGNSIKSFALYNEHTLRVIHNDGSVRDYAFDTLNISGDVEAIAYKKNITCVVSGFTGKRFLGAVGTFDVILPIKGSTIDITDDGEVMSLDIADRDWNDVIDIINSNDGKLTVSISKSKLGIIKNNKGCAKL